MPLLLPNLVKRTVTRASVPPNSSVQTLNSATAVQRYAATSSSSLVALSVAYTSDRLNLSAAPNATRRSGDVQPAYLGFRDTGYEEEYNSEWDRI